MKRLSILLVAALSAGCASAQIQTSSAATTENPIVESDVRRILTTLAADSMEGRATGSRGAYKAARFIAAEMKSLGLVPAGDSGYFQRVPFASTTLTGGRPMLQLLPS